MITATSKPCEVLNYVYVLNNTRIIDSGAIDHLTFDSRQVTLFTPYSQSFVSTANVNSVPIFGEWSSFYQILRIWTLR